MRRIWAVLPLIAMIVAFVAPLIVWIVHTLTEPPSPLSFSPLVLGQILLITVGYSVVVGGLSFLVGSACALLWYLETEVAKRCITLLMITAVTTGLIVRNYGWISLLSIPAIRAVVPILYTPAATILVMTLALAPMAFFVVRLGFNSVHPLRIAAARTLGANELTIFGTIVFGGVQAALMLAAVLTTAASLSYFITPQMLEGGRTYFIGNVIVKELNSYGSYRTASLAGTYLVAVLLMLPATWFSWRHFQSMRGAR
jgi:putative spermidine/putrescine transport system permease protein